MNILLCLDRQQQLNDDPTSLPLSSLLHTGLLFLGVLTGVTEAVNGLSSERLQAKLYVENST